MSDATDKSDAAWRPKANPWAIAIVVTMAAFMEILDTTIVNVSLPHIAGSVSASYDDATWALTSYLVANGIVLPISGFIGRVIGRKRYFLICIAMFTVSSFLCGTSTSLGELIVFRLMQGFFGGGLQPNQQSIILDTFEPAQRGKAFGVVAVAVIFAPVIGPTLGGWITDNYSWRWIFFINIPVGIFAFFAVAALVEDPPWVLRMKTSVRDFDYAGLGFIALGLGSLQIMLDRGEDDDWFSSPLIVVCAIMAVLGIVGAIWWLLVAKKPIVNLQAFNNRNFAVGSVMIFAIGAILYSGAVLLPQLAQQRLGYTATLAGLVLSPGALMILVLIPIVGRALPYVQTRYVIGFGFFTLGCAYSYAHGVTPDATFGTLALMRATQTLGLAFLFVPTSAISYSTMPRALNGDASSLYVMLRNVAGSIGISLATAGITERTQVRQSYLAEHLNRFNPAFNDYLAQTEHTLLSMGRAAGQVGSQAMGMALQTLNQQAAVLAYRDVFAYCAIAAFCIVPITFLFEARTTKGASGGAAISGSSWKPKGNPWLIALVVTLAAFMEILDTTIVNVALPHIAGALSSSNDEATWTLTSYLVANGIVLPISGFLANRLGRKRYFLICIAAFGLCSFLCGIAHSLPQLIIFRLAQGFFGGGLQPNQQAIILDTFPPEKRGMAFSITAVATIVAPVLGPVLGGWITDNYSWRWIFFINIPVSAFTFFAVSALVEDPPWVADQPKRKLDAIGLGLIALGLGCLQVVMDRGEDDDWFGSNFIVGMAIASAVGLIGAVWWLLTAKKPIVSLRVLGDRNFALGSFTTFALFGIVYSSAVLIPQLAQEVLNYDSTLAGLVLSPGAALVCITIPVVQRVMGFVQTKYIVAFGFFAMGLGMTYSMGLVPNIDYDTLAKMRTAQSFGIALLFVPISTLSYATLPKELNSDAAALYTMFRNVSGSIGISLATAMVTERTQVRTAHLVTHLDKYNQSYNDTIQRYQQTLISMGRASETTMATATGQVYQMLRTQAQVLAYSDVFMFCAIGAFCVIPFAFLFSSVKAKGGGGGH